MVCKNCGADLKPGVKYCLECGEYIDGEDSFEDDEYVSSDEDSSVSESVPTRRRKRKWNLTTTDYLIYGGLALVFFASILVIIVTLINDSSQPTTSPQPTATAVTTPTTVKSDKQYTIEDYSLTVSGKLDSTIQGSILYVTDNENYQFSFQVKKEDFNNYYENQAKLKDQLIRSKYEVLSVFEKNVNDRVFLIYEIRVEEVRKMLYFTPFDIDYTIIGSIELFDSGNWENALPDIDTVSNSISFENE